MKTRFPWLGAALLLIGTTMLLERFDVLSVGWEFSLWTLLAAFGGFTVVRGFSGHRPGRVFWGSFLFLTGICCILWELGVIDSFVMFPFILLMLGISFSAMFVSKPDRLHVLVPAIFFLGAGTVMFLADYGYLYRWEVLSAIRTYWPVALIMFGALLLLKRRSA